jgi:hypothetical protein
MPKRSLALLAAAGILGAGAIAPSFAGETTPGTTTSISSAQLGEEIHLVNGKLKAGKTHKWVKKCTITADAKKCNWVKVRKVPLNRTLARKPKATSSPSPTATSTATATPTSEPTASTATTTTTPSGWQASSSPSGNPANHSVIATGPDGKPIRWNPCAMPITWRFNNIEGPSNALELTQEAVNRISAATGFNFRYLGTTSVVPFASTNNTNPSDTHMVIAWATPTQVSNLAGGVVGMGGPKYAWTSAGSAKIVSAGVVIDSTDVAPKGGLLNGFQKGSSVGSVLLHEIAHASGLGHFDDTTQVMNPAITTNANAWYQAGDLGGFSKINASQPCFTW